MQARGTGLSPESDLLKGFKVICPGKPLLRK
jgi:hypothetical protein